jgi:hypothetical protein
LALRYFDAIKLSLSAATKIKAAVSKTCDERRIAA